MIGKDERFHERNVIVAANDNAEDRANAALRRIARLLGRQIAREEFLRRHAANDNRQERQDEG